MKFEFTVLLVLIFVFLLVFLFGPIVKRKLNEKYYKKLVSKTLYKYAQDQDVFLINEVKLSYGSNEINFDHILFGEKYIYCIKDIHEKVGIEGSAEDLKWFSYNSKCDVEYITNPFKNNNVNVALLMKYMNVSIEDKFFYSLIVCNDECDLNINKCRDDELIVKRKDLYKLIRNKEKDSSLKNINQEKLQSTVRLLFDRIEQSK